MPHPRLRIFLLVAGTAASIFAAIAIFFWGSCARVTNPYLSSAATYVGSAPCASCHAVAAEKWRASAHVTPMKLAGDSTVRHAIRIAPRQQYMCAECHTTHMNKNYDALANRFATTYSAANVGCEACHGPGSAHVTSRGKIALAPISRINEVERCARCHSAREQFADDRSPARPLGDSYRASLLTAALYHPDGQVRGEAFEYGSFAQSRMFAKGGTCSDCHDPHTSQLRASGNQVCARCHSPGEYQTPSHHFHQAGSRGADCIACHMPANTNVAGSPRHDHSIRIPEPSLSVTLGVPNACSNCHADRGAAWAAKQMTAWYGHEPRGYQQYAQAFAPAPRYDRNATRRLIAVAGNLDQPAIARATALELLAPRLGRSAGAATDVIRAGLYDPNPIVRRSAVVALSQADSALRVSMLSPLINDVVRMVRIEVARALVSDAPVNVDEYVAAERFNSDRAESRVNLSQLFVLQRRYAEAERELRSALALDGRLAPGFVNLADLYRKLHREEAANLIETSPLMAGRP